MFNGFNIYLKFNGPQFDELVSIKLDKDYTFEEIDAIYSDFLNNAFDKLSTTGSIYLKGQEWAYGNIIGIRLESYNSSETKINLEETKTNLVEQIFEEIRSKMLREIRENGN